jgi:CheY-like chemotaxis protein
VAATVSTSASISFISPSPPTVSKAVSAIEEGEEAAKPRALLVDDTPSNTKMLRVLLQRQGLVCDEAENGAVAVEMVRTSIRECLLGAPASAGYSLVFMDCNMPVMDGLTAARIIRSELLFDGLMVGCTGNANDHEVEEFLEAGADFVMPKPLRYTELQRLLEYAESVDFTSIPNTQLQLTDAPRLTTGSVKAKRRGSTEAESGQQRLKAVSRVRTGGNA